MASPGLQVFCSALLSLYSLRSFFLFVSLRFALLSSMVCVAPCSVCSPPKLQDFKTLTLTLTDRCHQMPNDELNADTTGLRQPCRVDDSNSTVDRLHYTTVYLNKSFCIIIIVWLVVVLVLGNNNSGVPGCHVGVGLLFPIVSAWIAIVPFWKLQ